MARGVPNKAKASDRLEVSVESEEQLSHFTRTSPLTVFVRDPDEYTAAVSARQDLGDMRRYGYERVLAEDVELMDPDLARPREKSIGCYWFDTDEDGFAIIYIVGQPMYIMRAKTEYRNERIEREHRYARQLAGNVSQDVAMRNQGMKANSRYELEEDERVTSY